MALSDEASASAGAAEPGARVRLDRRRGVFMISVAAELAEMHPQTLRMYEARGLITPKRSPKNTRLYSYEDVERLRRIQRMTAEEGLNLAGVETVLGLERELERARAETARMRERAAELERQMSAEVDAGAPLAARRDRPLRRVRRPARQGTVSIPIERRVRAAVALRLSRRSATPADGLDPVLERGLQSVRIAIDSSRSPLRSRSSAAWWTSAWSGSQPPLKRTAQRSPAACGIPQLCVSAIEPSSPLAYSRCVARPAPGRGRRRSAPCRRPRSGRCPSDRRP